MSTPGNDKRSLKINHRDNVATALEEIKQGEKVEVQDAGGDKILLIAKDLIPFGHKIALEDIAHNKDVIKYGASIGSTTKPISTGEYVHTHNLISSRAKGDIEHG